MKLGALASAAIVAIAGGCASPVPARLAGAPAGNQGDSWEMVFASPETTRQLAIGTEYGRRDAALGYETGDALEAAGGWPEPYRPSLDQARHLSLPTRASDILYLSDYAAPVYWYRSYWSGGSVRLLVP